jgi:SNF2 family DNA or RNA helicase
MNGKNKRIKLLPHQQDSYDKILNICQNNKFWIDDSRTGAGKTILTLEVAHGLNLPILVCCPLAAIHNWTTESQKYNVDIIDIMTYKSLCASGHDNQPYHGLLLKSVSGYQPTNKLIQLIKDGVLIIWDEAQHLTGNSIQSQAVRCVMSTLFKYQDIISRSAILSATLIDKSEQLLQMLYNIAVLDGAKYNMMVAQEFLTFALRICPEAVQLYTLVHSPHDGPQFVWELYLLIKEHITATMTASSGLLSQAECHYYNLYYPTSLTEYINTDRKDIFAVLKAIQMGKLDITYKLVCNIMHHSYQYNNITAWPKIVIYVSYLDIMDELLTRLTGFNPLCLHGQLNNKTRTEYIRLFNQNNCKYRILISTPQCGGVSVNLHSKNIRYPRISIMIPDYNTKNQMQSSGRFFREGAQGSSVVCCLYNMDQDMTEQHLIQKIRSKSHTMSQFHSDQPTTFLDNYVDINVDENYVITGAGLL